MPDDPHEAALQGDWDAVRAAYTAAGHPAATVTGYTNEARAFYDRDPNVLWITFARGRLWWTLPEPEVHWTGGDGAKSGTRHRIAIGGWRDCDIVGAPLDLERLSTRLTKLAAYRRTICGLNDEQQLLCRRYINADADPDQAAVLAAKAELETKLLVLIQRLSWSDFERLVDLIFTRSGWVRVSDLGGMQKDVDFVAEQPLTGERMAVQVKSEATQAVVDDYARRLANRAAGERAMLVCHSAIGLLQQPDPLELLVGRQVAAHAARVGLAEWVLERS